MPETAVMLEGNHIQNVYEKYFCNLPLLLLLNIYTKKITRKGPHLPPIRKVS